GAQTRRATSDVPLPVRALRRVSGPLWMTAFNRCCSTVGSSSAAAIIASRLLETPGVDAADGLAPPAGAGRPMRRSGVLEDRQGVLCIARLLSDRKRQRSTSGHESLGLLEHREPNVRGEAGAEPQRHA